MTVEIRGSGNRKDSAHYHLAALTDFNDRLQQVCETNHCERLLCDSSRDPSELFADYLQQRTATRRRW